MMKLCKECGLEKPDEQVKLGTCDDCFRYGAPTRKVGSDAFSAVSQAQSAGAGVILTTSINVPNRDIEAIVSIVASEVALGMSVFKDIANSWRDFVGGRANTAQKSLKEARSACLDELKREAAAIGADAVIAVDLNYNELTTGGTGGILFVAASGTAVKLRPVTAI